jgi:hypothetical protein
MIEFPNPLTFENAIALSQSLLDGIETGRLTGADWTAQIAALVGTKAGARGFLATYLTDPRPLADCPTPETIEGLKASPDLVAELLVKNLAMSTAMELTHLRNGDLEMAAQSAQVRDRATVLIRQLNCDRLRTEAQTLWQGLTQASGAYTTFLKKWGYDAEQQQAMVASLRNIFPEFAAATV